MADAGDRPPGSNSAPAGVRVLALGPQPLAQLRLFRPDGRELEAAGRALGLDLARNSPPAPGEGRALRLGPGEWLIRGGPGAAAIGERLADALHHVVDLGAARAAWRIEGERAADLLQCGCSLDLDPAVFTPGRCARTLLAGVVVVIERPGTDTALELIAETSLRTWLSAWLDDAAAGFAAPAAP